MKLPFNVEQFLNVFKDYNESVFPVQIIFIAAAVLCILLIYKKYSSKLVSGYLAFLWLWMGIVYHIIFFTFINQPALLFGIFFIVQGLLLFYAGVARNNFHYEINTNLRSITGLIFILYALIIYPIIGNFSGHVYPYAPTFGLPCPTTIFTFGIFLLMKNNIRLIHYLIPVIWTLIATSAATNLGIYEDYGLLVSCIIFLIIKFSVKKNYRTIPA